MEDTLSHFAIHILLIYAIAGFVIGLLIASAKNVTVTLRSGRVVPRWLVRFCAFVVCFFFWPLFALQLFFRKLPQ